MKKEIKGLLWISVCMLFLGGKDALISLWSTILSIFWTLFPILGRQAIENYFTSPYVIVNILMFIGSIFGIWFGKRGGKVLYQIVAFIVAIINLISICANIF